MNSTAESTPVLDLPTLTEHVRAEIARGLRPEPSSLEEWTEHRKLQLGLEQLPYCMEASANALLQLDALLRAAAASVAGSLRQSADGSVSMILLGREHYLPIAWTIDTFLERARRAQDALTRYVARAFKARAGTSLHEYVREFSRSQEIPADVASLLCEYWHNGGGAQLRDYRVLSQHHAVVSSDLAVTLDSGQPMIRVLLPSVATDKALEKIAYTEPYVHAAPYCREALAQLTAVAYRLLYLILRHLGVTQPIVTQLVRHPIEVGGTGYSALPPDDLYEFLGGIVEESFRASYQSFGSLGAPPLTR